MGTGLGRRTLKDIPYYPTPVEIYDKIMDSPGWPYKNKSPLLVARDKSLPSLLYLGGLRVSEALRIIKNQFIPDKDNRRWIIRSVELSKTRVKGKTRRIRFRDVYLPLTGERAKLTDLVMEYVNMLEPDERLYPWSLERDKNNQIVGCKRAWQVVKAYLPEETCHWLRAYCEDYLYGKWDRDILAVADYIKVNPRQLQEYIRRRHERYPSV